MSEKKRCEVSREFTWNLESIYENDQLWEADYEEAEKMIEHFKEAQGRIAADISAFRPVLDEYYSLWRRLEKIAVYARMRSDQDTSDTFYLKMASKASSLMIKAQAAGAFMEPEILGYSKEDFEKQFSSGEDCAFYRRAVEEMLRVQKHTLSASMEELLADAGNISDAPSDIFNILMNADMKFPDAKVGEELLPVSNSSFISYMESDDREKRRIVFETYYGQIEKFQNTFAAIYEANVKQALFYSKARKYTSDRAMYLDGSNVPESVYDNLINAVHEALPAMYRYVGMRKKILGVDELHMYDIYAQLFESADEKYDYETGKQMVIDALAPMGDDYISHIRDGFESRWIDIYPNEGKKSGAYSWGCYDSQPFILLNYMDNLDSVFTLAHELGHSLHSYYSNSNQDYAYAGYRIFVAEVASTCNESLLMHDLLQKTTDKKQKKYLLNHYIDSFKGTIFRQTMFAEFEKITHNMLAEGKPLTADVLCGVYKELNELYFGPEMVSDKEITFEWMKIPHFYTPFYVYQYATGYSAAIALSAKILKEGRPAVDAYMKFLKGGCSQDPIDLLKMAGVDMTTPEPVREALTLFDSLVTELESLMAEE